MRPIYAVTFLFELPFDIGLREPVGTMLFEGRGPQWDGWPETAVRKVLQLPEQRHLEPDVGPGTRLMIRRHRVRTYPPLLPVDRAFADWVEPLLPLHHRILRRARLIGWRATGLRKPVTAVALSRFVGPDDVPDGPTDERARRLYGLARPDLDRFLGLLGLSTGRWWLSPVTDRELPAVVGVLTEFVGPHEPVGRLRRRGRAFFMPVHDLVPNLADRELVDPEAVHRAAAIQNEHNAGALKLLPPFELLHESAAELNAGKRRVAVILATTAVEMLASELLRQGGPLCGWSEKRTTKALEAPFRNRVEHHLADLLGETVNVEHGGSVWGAWWADAYLVRNRLVHEGTTVRADEATAAWESVRRLLAHLGSRLAAIDSLRPLREEMASFRVVTQSAG
jgi:hypothetical protein